MRWKENIVCCMYYQSVLFTAGGKTNSSEVMQTFTKLVPSRLRTKPNKKKKKELGLCVVVGSD